MTPLESYLADLLAVRGTGTAETSGYPALANLLNEVGGSLKPKITAVIHPANSGAGLPDGGFFSAWVLWNEGNPKPGDRFRWREAAYHLGLPVLRTLFHQFAHPQQHRALGLEEVLDWTESTLARVERSAFFQRFHLGEAVQYFYEPFLAEFDPVFRKAA